MNTFFILFSYPQKEEILPTMHLVLEKMQLELRC